jgi:hypothetical protein
MLAMPVKTTALEKGIAMSDDSKLLDEWDHHALRGRYPAWLAYGGPSWTLPTTTTEPESSSATESTL